MFRVFKEILASRVILVILDHKARLVSRVIQVIRVLKAHKDSLDLKGFKVFRGSPVLKVFKATPVLKAFRVIQVRLA